MSLDVDFRNQLGIPRTAQLRVLGNGVVPRQAAHAIRSLLPELPVAEELDNAGALAA